MKIYKDTGQVNPKYHEYNPEHANCPFKDSNPYELIEIDPSKKGIFSMLVMPVECIDETRQPNQIRYIKMIRR